MANGQFLVADIPGAVERGLQFRQDEKLRPLKLEEAGLTLQQKKQGLQQGEQNLQFGQLRQQDLQQQIDQRTDKEKNQSLFNTALRVSSAKDEDIVGILETQIANVKRLGGDPSESVRALALANAGEFQKVKEGANNLIQIGVRQGDIEPIGGALKPKQKGEKGTVFDPNTGTFSIDPVAAQNQKDINTLNVGHKKQILALEVEATKAKERAKSLVAQERVDIEDGLAASQTMPVLMRADKLLDIVATGKPAQSLLWAKKWFGISPANATELDNLLGKQILKQLKPTFGSQFTAREGDWLKDIEANFGKSTEGNRALIRQGMDLIRERSRIGLDAAISSGDQRTADNIQGWLDWRFGEDTNAGQLSDDNPGKLSDDELIKRLGL
jgi:hypothetical protein